MSGLLGSLVSSVGAMGICVFAAAPSQSCASPPTDTGDAGSAAPDAGTPVGQDSGTGAIDAAPSPGDASTDAALSATADAAASANPDAGASMQGDAGPATAGGNELCRSEWPQSGGLLVPNMYMATDAAGSSYAAVNFVDNRPLSDDAGAPPQLNFGTPPSQVLDGFAVAKFDDACNLVWVREFGPASAPYSYRAPDGADRNRWPPTSRSSATSSAASTSGWTCSQRAPRSTTAFSCASTRLERRYLVRSS